jgi:2,4-dienoyl-CoA reductase-like NADH-dependent reductase (Old Yellow Enzyme family)
MLFSPWQLRGACAPNRLWRAATYEGLADPQGAPSRALGDLYVQLAVGGVGAIITGFCYVSRAGRAMQPRQCGIDADEKIAGWRPVVAAVREVDRGTLLFMQIAHAGRQTLASSTGGPVLAPTDKVSPYFRSRPIAMDEDQIRTAIGEFVAAARRAQRAGFDGVELHAAHGYLIHQFLSPYVNDRRDVWGEDRLAFLREILSGIRAACGADFPVLVKVSAGDFHPGGVDAELAAGYAARLGELGVAAVEVSCGTMDLAMNIFRGGLPVQRVFEHNPLIGSRPAWQKALWKRFALPRQRRRLEPFAEAYNRDAARAIRRRTAVPLILVGGLRSRTVMDEILASGDADAVALCRPWIREPDLAVRLRADPRARSTCVNCNLCAVMCDSTVPLCCYHECDSTTRSRCDQKENGHDTRN